MEVTGFPAGVETPQESGLPRGDQNVHAPREEDPANSRSKGQKSSIRIVLYLGPSEFLMYKIKDSAKSFCSEGGARFVSPTETNGKGS